MGTMENGSINSQAGMVVGDGWHTVKILWIGDPSYAGPLLIRGYQLDGENGLKFGFSTDSPMVSELMLGSTKAGQGTLTGWRSWPSYTFIRAPGCYAYQIDGLSFSQTVIFKASP
jgi:hypothetical protein